MAEQHHPHLGDEDLHLLVESFGRDAAGQTGTANDRTTEAHRHAETCSLCRSRLQEFLAVELELKKLPTSRPAKPGVTCPPEDKWIHLAGGLQAPEEAEELIQHAAQCDQCGSLLRQIIDDFETPIRPDEEEILAKAVTADEDWQRALVGKMISAQEQADSQRTTNSTRHKSQFAFPRWALATAAATIIGITSIGWVLLTRGNRSVETLLAASYSEHRTLEMRIPGADFGPTKLVRGPEGSPLERPRSLLQAEDMIAGKLASSPEAPSWLQAKGRAELLEDDYSAAIDSLRRAEEAQPNLPEINTDLATAYFQRAQAENRTSDFGNAVELLSRELARHPDNKVALFNHAIALERMGFYTQAVEEWEHYLRLDSQSKWSGEARDRLANVKKKLQSKGGSGPLRSPQELALLVTANKRLATQIVDQRIEEYQDLATEEWLPEIVAEQSALTALAKKNTWTALEFVSNDSKVRHGDDWLSNLLDASSSQQFPAAVRALRNVEIANTSAQYRVALTEATAAEQLFQQIGNDAGIFKVRYEKAFALQFSGAPHRCANYAEKTDLELSTRTSIRYTRLRALLGIEAGICQNLAEDFGAANQTLASASRMAESSSYRLARLRAQTMMATVLWSEGNEDAAWNLLASGIDACLAEGCPPMRAYSLYANMDEFAEDNRQTFLQMAAAQEAVQTITGDSDHLMRALEHNRLAKAAQNVGLQEKAAANFQIAQQLMASADSSNFTRNYEAEIAVNLAELEAEHGDPTSAMQHLSALKRAVMGNSDPYLKVDFFDTLAALQMRSGNLEEAKNSLERASAFSIHESCSLSSLREHLIWRKRSERTFRRLVEVELQQGNPVGALERWEWYLAAAPCSQTDKALTANVAHLLDGDRAPPLPVPRRITTALPDLRTVTFLSYAVLSKQIVVWVYDNRGVLDFTLAGSPDELAHLGNQFSRLCSDPTSDTRTLENVSHQLYTLLFAPIDKHLDPSRVLIIAGDDRVTGLPLQALRNEAGAYLADDYDFVYSSGLYGWSAAHDTADLNPSARALIVGVRGAPSRGFALLPDISEETQFVAHAFRNSVLLEGQAATRSNLQREISDAVVFHYAGHGLVLHQRVGLLLAAPDGQVTNFLDASDLQPVLLRKTQLVVLSACATGGSDTAEGIGQPDSLARAFLDAGVPRVVASRWDVNSAVTVRFMQRFYAALQTGVPVPKALADASRALRMASDTRHPYYWAAFSAFGKNI